MSIIITPIDIDNDTFEQWIEKSNNVIDALTLTVTVNSHANGDLSTGNGYVDGIFGSRTLVANTLRGGTVQTPNVLNISSNLNINVNSKLVLGDVVINSSDIVVNSVSIINGGVTKFTVDTQGTTAQLVDSYSKLTYRSSEYIISLKDLNANAYQASKLLTVHDSGDTYLTEYGVVFSNNALGEFSANANSTHVRVYITPSVANTTIKGLRTTIEI